MQRRYYIADDTIPTKSQRTILPSIWTTVTTTATATTTRATNVEYVETDLESILVTPHATERRVQRQITMGELRSAIQYGVKEPCGDDRFMYTWNGVVVITDPTSSTIVTSWTLPGFGVDLPKVNITPEMKKQHANARDRLKDLSTWTSHTVAVVDTSGSMRKTDAEQALTRWELVWLTLAVQLIAKNLKSGEQSDSDVFSVVGMQSGGKVLIREQPYDWLLYNQLVDVLRSQSPRGPGEYSPALQKAQSLLMANQYGGCALALLFLSDGRPSDHAVRKGPNVPYERRIKLEILKTSMKQLTSATTATMVLMGKRICRKFRKGHLPM